MKRSVSRMIPLLTLYVALMAAALPVHAGNLQPPGVNIPTTLFGMHIHRAASTTPWPTAPFGSLRLWDAYVAWPWLEPAKGVWRFENLDKLVALAQQHGVEVLLPIGLTPTWASARPTEYSAHGIAGIAAEPVRMEDWRNYVRTVATRYKGRIRHYEIWNEPNYKSMFSGTPDRMVALAREAYRILKEVDPGNTVVSPAVGIADNAKTWDSWLTEFLAKGGGNFCDVVGVHIYVSPAPPEAVPPVADKVRQMLPGYGLAGKPLWNTEAGWLIENHDTVVSPQAVVFTKVLTDAEASAYVARMYILSWAAGIGRYYFYAWDNKIMGLTEADGVKVKPPARAYAQVYEWLAGARMTSCAPDAGGTWTARITRDGGYAGWIVWNPDRKVPFTVPGEWGIGRYRNLAGDVRGVSGRTTVDVGPQPVLFEHTSK